LDSFDSLLVKEGRSIKRERLLGLWSKLFGGRCVRTCLDLF
jgi:hypothetical protein